ncbi:dinucleotide-utilizing protein [Leptospira noumeaensis]|uniref:Dinucleotide-utilizing protein n=1 Tax=Leptospira noumeaensis TaxID=2484964 RepID=A0A4R9I1F3_9LEPT|nr:HesA/MoeB/ThiF family protein [Leptospira noumeaensis]TGK79147.1 dinucleotide-utilizing protein [Leptospira noumeaensis]
MGSEEDSFFQRQIQVPEIGSAGQKKWKDSSVLVIGLGGLGCPAALQLALGGIGRIGLIDFDRVEVSNLHRQTLFTFKDLGLPKVEVVSKVLLEHCPWLQIECFFELISESTKSERLDGWDLVLDCTDTISSKYVINDLCVSKSVPLVTASVFRTSSQFAIFSGEGKPCYRCLFPDLKDGDTMNCSVGGVLGLQTALAGTYQTSLAMQYLLDPNGTDLSSVYFMEWNPPLLFSSKVEANLHCPVCGDGHKETNRSWEGIEIDSAKFIEMQSQKKVILLDVREKEETENFPIADTVLVPLSQLEKGYLLEVPEWSSVVCICETGIRSKKAVTYINNGKDVYSLLGGRRAYLSFLQNKNSI